MIKIKSARIERSYHYGLSKEPLIQSLSDFMRDIMIISQGKWLRKSYAIYKDRRRTYWIIMPQKKILRLNRRRPSAVSALTCVITVLAFDVSIRAILRTDTTDKWRNSRFISFISSSGLFPCVSPFAIFFVRRSAISWNMLRISAAFWEMIAK